MKEIKKWETEDGESFDTLAQAHNHEIVLKTAKAIIELVKPAQFRALNFSNGEGFIQLREETLTRFVSSFRNAVRDFCSKDYLETFDKGGPQGFIGRYLSDGDSPLYAVYIIGICIDDKCRLWGQPYFALHPDEGKQIQLNTEPI